MVKQLGQCTKGMYNAKRPVVQTILGYCERGDDKGFEYVAGVLFTYGVLPGNESDIGYVGDDEWLNELASVLKRGEKVFTL